MALLVGKGRGLWLVIWHLLCALRLILVHLELVFLEGFGLFKEVSSAVSASHVTVVLYVCHLLELTITSIAVE